jgi:hypothetical protein
MLMIIVWLVWIMAGKQAKVLSDVNIDDLEGILWAYNVT